MGYKHNRFAWIDIETTGLDQEQCPILEVACIVTDGVLEELGRIHYVRHWPSTPESRALMGVSPVVEKVHTDNGLWALCNKEGVSLGQLDTSIAGGVRELCGDEKPVLAGSSVHFDRTFIARQMPSLHAALHYRNFDVTTLRLMAAIAGQAETKEGARPGRASRDVGHSILSVDRPLRASVLLGAAMSKEDRKLCGHRNDYGAPCSKRNKHDGNHACRMRKPYAREAKDYEWTSADSMPREVEACQ